jgi:hypothetical protein
VVAARVALQQGAERAALWRVFLLWRLWCCCSPKQQLHLPDTRGLQARATQRHSSRSGRATLAATSDGIRLFYARPPALLVAQAL